LINLIHPLDGGTERGQIRAVTGNDFDRKASDPLRGALCSDETAHFVALLEQGLNKMASNESGSTCDQRPPDGIPPVQVRGLKKR
jgi:hypothetical protein